MCFCVLLTPSLMNDDTNLFIEVDPDSEPLSWELHRVPIARRPLPRTPPIPPPRPPPKLPPRNNLRKPPSPPTLPDLNRKRPQPRQRPPPKLPPRNKGSSKLAAKTRAGIPRKPLEASTVSDT